MGDGLMYVLEVDAKEKGVGELSGSLSAIEKLLHLTYLKSGKAAEGHKKQAHEAKGLHGVLDKLVHAGMHPFLEKAKSIAEFEFVRKGVDALIEAPGEIIEKIKELGSEMIHVAAHAERTNKSFKLLFGAKEGAELLEFIDEVSGHTEFTDDRLKSVASTLGKVGFKGEGLKRAMAAATDMAALSGGDKDAGLEAALGTLEMVKRTGMVTRGTLGGLGLGNKDFFAQLSQRTGESVETLKKKMAKGKVDANDAIESLYTLIGKKTGKQLGGAGIDMGNTLSAKLTHLQDLPEQFFQRLADSPGLGKFTEVIGTVLEGLSPESPTGQKIFVALDRAFTLVGQALHDIDWEGVFKKIGQVIDELPPKIEAIVSGIKAVAPFILEVLGWIGKAIVGLAYIAGDNGPAIENVKAANEDKVAKDHEAALDAIQKKFGFGRDGKYAAVADGLVKGTKGEHPEVHEAGADLGGELTEGAEEELGVESPSKVFAHLGEMTAQGFAEGVSGSSAIDDVMAGAFAVPAPQVGGGIGGRGGGGNSVTIGDIYVNAAGGDARETAEAVRSVVVATLLEQFERLQAEQGG